MGITDRNHDLTNGDNEIDDDLPSVEKLLRPILPKKPAGA
jgi:hypothetical protein